MSEFDHDLDAIMRTDRFVDALASGARMSSVDPLSSMLGAWRDDVRSRPDAHVATLAQASAALADAQKPARRNRFGLAVVGAAAAAVLGIGGFTAVVFDAKPGDALYGLHAMLFGESQKTRDDAVVLAAQTELAQVQQLVQQGQWEQAQQKLVTLSSKVQSVDNTQSKQQLVEHYNALTVKVIQRDPEATLPPAGEPMPPLPSSPLSLLPIPVIDTTTTTQPTEPSTPPSTEPPTQTTVVTTVPTPSPTTTVSLPTPTGPSSTVTAPTPTPTTPQPTTKVPRTAPSPTPTAASPSASAAAPPPVTVTTSQTPAVASTATTPSVAATSPPTAAPSTPKTTQADSSKRTSVVTTVQEEPANPQTSQR